MTLIDPLLRRRGGYILSRSPWRLALYALVIAAALPVMSQEPQGNGVRKFKPAQTSIREEFNSEDPVALAAGAHISTDCSINWTAADGKALPQASPSRFKSISACCDTRE